jgi:SOS-response transcriptional repressor LexA
MLANLSIAHSTGLAHNEAMSHIDWLKAGLQRPGKSNAGLAKALGVNPSAVSRMLKGARRLQLDEVAKAATYLGIEPPNHANVRLRTVAASTTSVHVVELTKSAAGGVWREEGVPVIFEAVAIPLVPEPKLAGLKQYATRVDGTDFNKVLKPGDYAIFVPFSDIRKAPQDGDIVEVERRRGDAVETTVRRVRLSGGVVELWPESDNPAWEKPHRLTSAERDRTEITGFYVGLFRPNPVFVGGTF